MLTVGQLAPDFELPNQDGDLVKLSDYRGKNVIMFAFPKADTSGCNIQACAFRDTFPKIEDNNAVIFGISSDTVEDLASWKVLKNLNYDLLSDVDHKVLEEWGAWGLDLKVIKLGILATRSYWVIDKDGVLADQQIGVKPEESVEKALATVANLA
jgi:thioredoxin-dependent peroxiredoxin